MKNIALLTEYDGTAFHGWQSQKGLRNVQDEIRKAVLTITGENIVLTGCSRTDAGVHAKGHVSNFKTGSTIPTEKFAIALNCELPPDISVLKSAEVPESFHARYDAKGKEYRYRIVCGPSRPALDRCRVYHCRTRLDLNAMQAAASYMTGTHDFRAFMAAGSQVSTTVRTLYSVEVISDDSEIDLLVKGSGFLYNMVRILAGTLFYVGNGRYAPEDVAAIIGSGDRRTAGKTLPAYGLYLEKVFYSDGLFGYNI